jgi:hypothetical protein
METRINLPPYDVRLRTNESQKEIFDVIRKKYVALTPEEWVRQHFINYLVTYKGFPMGLVAVEHPILINRMQQRVDIVAFNRSGEPILVVECKAPQVKLTSDTYAQAARYNLILRTTILVVTNGLSIFCSKIDLENGKYYSLQEIPSYNELIEWT